MRILVRSITVQKKGNNPKDNDDAYYYTQNNEKTYSNEFNVFSCAISDGATESSFPSIWARLLATEYVNNKAFRENLPDHLTALQNRWKDEVNKMDDLPWFAEVKSEEEGAFATLLGLTLYESGDWEAIAIGDSCLFHVRDEELLISFPIKSPEEFKNTPFAISSLSVKNKEISNHIQKINGTWQKGDTFYLMTDAWAQWTLKQVTKKRAKDYWSFTENALNQVLVDINRMIKDKNQEPWLKNDDVTCVRLYVD
jgi:hypothetical protein